MNTEFISPKTDAAVIVRRADETDAELLADLGAETFWNTYIVNNKVEDMNAYIAASFNPSQLKSELKDSDNRFFLAEIEGETIGYAKFRVGIAPPCVKGEKPLELARIYVLKNRFGCGAGEKLMQIYRNEAQQGGHDAMWLIVWKENWRALAFYRKWNFREIGEHRFQIGSNMQTDWVMQRVPGFYDS